MTERQLHHQGPPQHQWKLNKSWEPAQPTSSSTDGKASFPSSSIILNLFQAASLVQSLLHIFVWKHPQQLGLFTQAERVLVCLVSFRDVLKLFWLVYFPAEELVWMFHLGGNCYKRDASNEKIHCTFSDVKMLIKQIYLLIDKIWSILSRKIMQHPNDTNRKYEM